MPRRQFSGETSHRQDRTGLRRRLGVLCTTLPLTLGLGSAPAAQTATAATGDGATAPARTSAADLDILYAGAHPDDEAGRLSMFGEWKERYGARTGS